MTLSEMRQRLDQGGIQLTKSMGQNFLHDVHHLERIVAAADLGPGDAVLEIGPGLGPLTEHLLKRAGMVVAIEKDARLVKALEERFRVAHTTSLPANLETRQTGETPTLRLVHADALDLLRQRKLDWSGWKMVSNLPYSVASPILVELCQGNRSPRTMVATLQAEVAQRLASGPSHKIYGILTVLIQLDFEPGPWFKIPPGCFFPEPDVESACVVLNRRPALLLPEALRPAYARIVKRAFSQRRKMMHKLLKQDWNPELLDAAYRHAGLSLQVRAEAVSLEQFVKLTRQVTDWP